MNQKSPGNFRPLFYFLSVVLLFLVLVDLLFLRNQYSMMIELEKKNVQEELQLMGTLMREALLKHDYATIENFVQSWGKTHTEVAEIRAVAKNGFIISEFRRDIPNGDRISGSSKIEYSGDRFITVYLEASLGAIKERFRTLILNVTALSVVLTIVMAALLWYTISKTAIKPMRSMLEKINRLNEELEQRVEERTEALRKTNVSLEGEISERKQAEKDKERLESQLLQSQKMEAVGRLAGGVAHDFNNMLTVILGYAELARDQMKQDDPLLNYLTMIEKAAEHSRDITRQLLAFSRKQISEPKVIDLNHSLAYIEKTLARLIGEDVELVSSPGDNLWKIKIDPSQVDQILVNLAINARDAMPEGGRLTIRTRNLHLDEAFLKTHVNIKSDEYVLLEVSDTGSGIDIDTLPHVFEPFFTTKETGKGTGLGLATVYGIVHQNNGIINVYSEPGQGTVFKIFFPRVLEEPEGEREAAEVSAYKGRGTVLLVEDNDMVRDVTAQMLSRIGFSVIGTAKPDEALSLAGQKDTAIDLILTDMIMPAMSGKELCEKIRIVRPDAKVLFMSGYATEFISRSGMLDHGMHFIQKPFSEKDLGKKIKETIS
jgi:signal transduction histidine kinase